MRQTSRSRSLRIYLLGLVLVATIPLFVFSAFMVNWLVGKERAAAEKTLESGARQLAELIDYEISNSISTLEAIAVTESLRSGDLKKFHLDSQRLLTSQPMWTTLVVHDPTGRLLLSSIRRFGEPLEQSADPASLLQVFESGRPQIGALVTGRSGSKLENMFAFAIRVPVFREGKVVLSLSAIVRADYMQEVVSRLAFGEAQGWLKTITDVDGTVVARSRLPERFVGKAGTASYIKSTRSATRGFMRETNLEGAPVYLAFSRAPVSQWTAAVIVPVKLLDASAARAQLMLSAIGALLLIVVVGLAIFFANHFARLIGDAASAAESLASGSEPVIKETKVREVEQLHHAILNASRLLKQRESERNGLLEVANSARLDAEAANRAKSEFLANMSHELRTPLGVILGVLDIYSDPNTSAEEMAHLFERLKRNSDYLAGLIDQVLDLSKVEANALELEVRPIVLKDVLEDVVSNLGIKASLKGVSLNLENLGLVQSMFRTDPLRVKQILTNIIGNSVKFTERGEVTISVRGDLEDPRVIDIFVKDTGVGITKEQEQRLFRPFSQGDSSMTRRFGGTGLGLTFSRRLARELGGDVALVESAPGKGSTFRVRLRDLDRSNGNATKAAPLPVPQSNKTEVPTIGSKPLEGMRILIVDDSVDNRFLLNRILRSAGARTSEVGDGERAIESASAEDFDVVLMDIQMPILDGNRATAELRSRGYTRPIIALTAHAMKDDREKAMKSGYDDYLTKPVDKFRLVDTLTRIHRGDA